MKEAEIWQQEHHEVIWQTAVQTKIWRGRLKGGEEKVLKHNSKFTGGKKKKAEIISCLRSSAWFILRLRNCAVDFTMFTALKQKRNAWQGYIWKHPAPWVLLESVGNRVLSLAHAPAEVVCHLVVVRFQLLLELVCTGDCLWHLVVSPSGTAPKCTAVMLWSPSIFRLESAMSIILDKDFLLKQKSWLIILTRWAGVNVLITSFLDSVKSRRKLEKRAWRKANTIYVKGK